MLADDLEKTVDIIRQFLRRHRRVFNEGERLRVLFHRHRKTERGLAQIPDTGLLREFQRMEVTVAKAALCEILFTRGEPRGQALFSVVVELDAQDRAGVAFDECLPNALQIGTEMRVIENELVHHLAGGWMVP